MRIKKRLILMIVISMLVMPNSIMAKTDISYEKMAEALNKLSILKGDGENYNLSGQLRRSEAVTFLVRLLGVEQRVIEDKNIYMTDKYSDVLPTQWYSYYIGYASSAGIVYGYNDGTFRPNEFVTEKEFTKMILGALNYKQCIDYEWDEIYQFGYSIGLFDDSYKDKNDDNLQYARQDAIKLMYNALKTKINKLEINITEKLIERNVFSVYKAIEAGIIIDEIKSDVATINILDESDIRILFTEKVDDFDKDNIVIYEAEDENKKLEVKEIKIDNDTVTIKTAPQKADKKYKLVFKELIDENGLKITNVNKLFRGYVDEYIEADYFVISKVKAKSKNIVNVYYTHPINIRAISPACYKIYRGKELVVDNDRDSIGVALIPQANNGVSIFLRNYSLEDGVEYTIEVDGKLKSKYSVGLNEDRGDSFTFIGNCIPNESFKIENAEILNERYVTVTFNNTVDKSSATSRSKYRLIDNNGHSRNALGAVLVNDGEQKTVMLKFSGIVESKDYELEVVDVYDSYKQMDINGSYSVYSYYDDESEEESLIDCAYTENQNTLIIYFNKAIPKIYNANFSIRGASVNTVQYDNEDPKKITIYTDKTTPLEEDIEYTVSVHNARNEFKEVYRNIECDFEGISEEFGEIDIIDCRFISDEKLYIEFDKNISFSDSLVSKFKLEYERSGHNKTISAQSISSINDRAVIVRFRDVDDSEEYRLNINSLKDYSNQFTTKNISTTID